MLTVETRYQNKMKYLTLLSKLNIDLTELTKFLDSVDYFEKPFTSQNFKAYAGGLCEYALAFYNELAQLCNAYCPGMYREEDVIKVALFKDIYRACCYEQGTKNVKNEETGQWETVVCYKQAENKLSFGDLNFSSYMIAKRFVNFTDEQIEAIINGDFKNSANGDLQDVRKAYKLVILTGMANIVCYYL